MTSLNPEKWVRTDCTANEPWTLTPESIDCPSIKENVGTIGIIRSKATCRQNCELGFLAGILAHPCVDRFRLACEKSGSQFVRTVAD